MSAKKVVNYEVDDSEPFIVLSTFKTKKDAEEFVASAKSLKFGRGHYLLWDVSNIKDER